jgi:hypothetical protein
MRQLAWRDKVSIDAVLCRLRFGPGRGDSKPEEKRKPCDPPMTVSLTNAEWAVAMAAKRESEAADAEAAAAEAKASSSRARGKTEPKKKRRR